MGLQAQITKLNMNYDDDMQRFRNGTALAHLHGFWTLQEWIAGNIEGSDPEGNAFIVSTELSLNDIARAYEDISKQYGHTHTRFPVAFRLSSSRITNFERCSSTT